MVRDMRQQFPRELHGAEARVSNAIFAKNHRDLLVEKSHVERRIMRDQYRVADELEKSVDDIGKDRRIRDHFVADSGQGRDERRYRHFRIYQGLKLVGHTTVSDAIRADLGHAARRSFGTGCFEIKNNKLGVEQLSRLESILNEFD